MYMTVQYMTSTSTVVEPTMVPGLGSKILPYESGRGGAACTYGCIADAARRDSPIAKPSRAGVTKIIVTKYNIDHPPHAMPTPFANCAK